MSFQRLFPTFPIPHFGHAVALVEVVPYALTRIKSGLLDGTVSVWQINEGAGTVIDDVVGVNDGTIYGSTWTTDAISGGYALEHDGIDDYDSCGNDPSLSPSSALTLEFWTKYLKIPTVSAEEGGISKWNWPAGMAEYLVRPEDATGLWHVDINLAGTVYSVEAGTVETVWQYIVVVWDGSTLYLYKNASLVGSTSAPGTLTRTDVDFEIGRFDAGGSYCNAIFDEIRFYNRALTSAEISDRYNYGLKIRITNLLEGQKAELYDPTDVLKASYTLGVGETEAILDVAALTFPFEGYFKIYDVDGVTLLLKTGIYTDIWGGDVYKFETL